jgi:hypothetical protein
MQVFRPPPPAQAQPQRGGKNARMIRRAASQLAQMPDPSGHDPTSHILPVFGRILNVVGIDGGNPGGKKSLSQDRAFIARRFEETQVQPQGAFVRAEQGVKR